MLRAAGTSVRWSWSLAGAGAGDVVEEIGDGHGWVCELCIGWERRCSENCLVLFSGTSSERELMLLETLT